MTQLDKDITILFERMIKSWDKISNIKDGIIEFNNGLSIYARKKKSSKDKEDRENIPLKLDQSTFSYSFFEVVGFEVINPDTDKLLFYINTPYRQYRVPEHDRHDYIDVLDILDESIKKFEEKKLNEYKDYFESRDTFTSDKPIFEAF